MVRVVSRFCLLLTTTWSIFIAPISQDFFVHGKALRSLEKVFTNGWAVKIHGGVEAARNLAKEHGFDSVERVGLGKILRGVYVGPLLVLLESILGYSPCSGFYPLDTATRQGHR